MRTGRVHLWNVETIGWWGVMRLWLASPLLLVSHILTRVVLEHNLCTAQHWVSEREKQSAHCMLLDRWGMGTGKMLEAGRKSGAGRVLEADSVDVAH